MECDERGVWSVERPAKEGDIYQYVITTPTLEKHYRSDPFAVYSEVYRKMLLWCMILTAIAGMTKNGSQSVTNAMKSL